MTDGEQYIAAKRTCRRVWELSLEGFDKLPGEYQQILLDHFNRVWSAGLRNGSIILPSGQELELGALCQLDRDVYEVAQSTARYND